MQLTHVIALRLTESERVRLRAAAATFQQSVSKFARAALKLSMDGGANGTLLSLDERRVLSKAIRDLGRIGSNLNQIAFSANLIAKGIGGMRKAPDPDDIQKITSEIAELIAAMKSFLNRIENGGGING